MLKISIKMLLNFIIVNNQVYLQLQIQQYLLEFHFLIGIVRIKCYGSWVIFKHGEASRIEKTDLEDKSTDVES